MRYKLIMRSVVALVVVFAALLAGCAKDDAKDEAVGPGTTGTDTDVTFKSGRLTVHGSLRMPDGAGPLVPAVVLVAGSGPTDRNGDSRLIQGSVGTLTFLADELARNGIASLRYDKLGTGATALGPYTTADLPNLGFTEFVAEAADATRFLATQKQIDPKRLGVIGHGEGGLIALALANGYGGEIPPLSFLGLVEPLSVRFLTALNKQVTTQIAQAVSAGTLSDPDGQALVKAVDAAINRIRSDGTIAPDLPAPLQSAGLIPANAKALAEEDKLDPLYLASTLPKDMPVLTSCSDSDIQVPCDEVEALAAAMPQAKVTQVHLANVDHVLKDVGDEASTGAEYGQPLPVSSDFAKALANWVSSL